MADYVITQGDTQPVLTDTLSFTNGEAVNLEGATVTLIVRAPSETEPRTLTGVVEVEGPETAGEVTFRPTAEDTAKAGNLMASWHVKWPGGVTMTFPTEGYLWVQIQPNLTSASSALLVGLPEVKEHLYIPAMDRSHDDNLTRDIRAVRPLIENLTGPIIPETFNEWHEGGHATIQLRHIPSFGYGTEPILNVMAVSEYRGPIEYNISIVGTPTQGSVYSEMTHEEMGLIVRRTSGGGSQAWWRDPEHPKQSVHVVYQAGQSSVPENVTQAAVETIRWWFQTTETVGRGSMARADEEGFGKPMMALPPHVIKMLSPTRRAPSFA